jgi:hypothetical protein
MKFAFHPYMQEGPNLCTNVDLTLYFVYDKVFDFVLPFDTIEAMNDF